MSKPNTFKCRAEMVLDFLNFLQVHNLNGMKMMIFYLSEINITSPTDNLGWGAICSFTTTLSMEHILDMIGEVHGGHRMFSTLNYADKFTNEEIR
jgi:hypothetical protein